MANLALWLVGLVGPLAKRVLLALGIGWISYTGMSALADQLKSTVASLWGQMGTATLQILTLGGTTEAVGIILSAIAAAAALAATSRLGKLTS